MQIGIRADMLQSMTSIIQDPSRTSPQLIEKDWYGAPVAPPLAYSFALSRDELIFKASRQAPARIHPEAQPGRFQPELWRYDTAEFFIAAAEGGRYLEFNLCPNGAWWACAFDAARQAAAEPPPSGVSAAGQCSAEGWSCEAHLPLSELKRLGIDPSRCRLVATAILNTPEQIFLTTADSSDGEPDFHRPDTWPTADVNTSF